MNNKSIHKFPILVESKYYRNNRIFANSNIALPILENSRVGLISRVLSSYYGDNAVFCLSKRGSKGSNFVFSKIELTTVEGNPVIFFTGRVYSNPKSEIQLFITSPSRINRIEMEQTDGHKNLMSSKKLPIPTNELRFN